MINKVPKTYKIELNLPQFLVSKFVNGLQKLLLLEKTLEKQDRVSKLIVSKSCLASENNFSFGSKGIISF